MLEKSSASQTSVCDELLTFALDQIVLQEEQEAIFAKLKRSVDADTAEQIYRNAMYKYIALKKIGKLSDYEYDLHVNPMKNPPTLTERFGPILMLVGLLGLMTTVVGSAFLHFKYSTFSTLLGLSIGLIPTGFFMYIFGRDAEKLENGKMLLSLLGGKSLVSLLGAALRTRKTRR